jgi:putative FmdB family regulatory protein
MPIYEYRCQKCGFKFEIKQKVDQLPPNCDNTVISGSVERICGGICEKLISKSSFSLKGGGWYKDGYVKPSKKS